MSYALSFADRFFSSDDHEAIAPSERPENIYQAIISLREDTWRDMARDVFAVPPEMLEPDAVLAKIIETDTCSNLDEPVEVWVDPAGNYLLSVYGPEPTY